MPESKNVQTRMRDSELKELDALAEVYGTTGNRSETLKTVTHMLYVQHFDEGGKTALLQQLKNATVDLRDGQALIRKGDAENTAKIVDRLDDLARLLLRLVEQLEKGDS